MKQLLKPFDYFFVLKPVMLFPVWVLFLSGFYVQNNLIAPYIYDSTGANGVAFDQTRLIWIGLAVSVLIGAIFVLNQVMDRKNSEKKTDASFIAPDKLTPKSAFIESTVLLALALGAGFFFSWKIGVLAFVILLLFGYLFNFTPFAWKEKPLLALITHVLTAFLVFEAGWLVNGSLSGSIFVQSIPYICFFLALILFKAVQDESGVQSPFAEKFGFTTTLYIATLFTAIAIAVAFNLKDELIFYPALFALPFFFWAAISAKNSEVERALKYSMVFLIIAISFKWGIVFKNYVLIVSVAVLYFASKIYYHFRFGLNYPTLAVETGEKKA